MDNSFAAPPKTGRPIGLRLKPQIETVADFVHHAIAEPMRPPPKPKTKTRNPKRKAGIWENMTAEERSMYGKRLAAMRKASNMRRQCQRPGTPKSGGWTHESAAVAKTAARLEAEQLVTKLIADGTIDLEDKEGANATIEALTIVRSPGARSERMKWAKRLLRHYAPEAASLL